MIVVEDDTAPAAEEGDNYFVSMTDMMVGVLFIFLIMLMVFALDFRTKSDSQDVALDVARQAAEKVEALQLEVQANISALDESAALRRTLLEQIQEQLHQRGIQVEISKASDVLRIRENAVEFETGESVLDQRAQQNVEIISEVLSSVLRDYVACRAVGEQRVCSQSDGATIETVFIEGHTDSRGDDRNNWELSTARAAQTFQHMVQGAPDLRSYFNRNDQEILSVSGYSSARPVDSEQTLSGRAANRRIDLRFVIENDSRERLEQLRSQTDDMSAEINTLMQVLGEAR